MKGFKMECPCHNCLVHPVCRWNKVVTCQKLFEWIESERPSRDKMAEVMPGLKRSMPEKDQHGFGYCARFGIFSGNWRIVR